jgi:uncharacterized protein (TIGR03790 family)
MFTAPNLCRALEPKEILVVANGKIPESISLSKYYMAKRKIPSENLVILEVPDQETICRKTYEENIAGPVRAYLKDKNPFRVIRCLATMYGLPLRVVEPSSAEDTARLKGMKNRKTQLKTQIEEAKDTEHGQIKAWQEELTTLKVEIASISKATRNSSVDSEIALVLEEAYPLESWIPNPYFVGYPEKQREHLSRNVLMVSRLDGPSEAIVRRIIDDSLATEEAGLRGRAYFDARWPRSGKEAASSYRSYDESIHIAAELVKKSGIMPVVLDTRNTVFQPGECPTAALYCGWYSLANYVDAFEWQAGAVGYHIASSECVTLKRENSRVWCKMMLEKGAAATLGPVGEPYVETFPVPAVFFGLLIEGTQTLAECYTASNPCWSWQMVLIGDPLYRPFKHIRKQSEGSRTEPPNHIRLRSAAVTPPHGLRGVEKGAWESEAAGGVAFIRIFSN